MLRQVAPNPPKGGGLVPIPDPCLTVAFLDAGQGDCIVIKFPQGTVWLVDCGSSKNPGVVTPEIKKALDRLLPSSGRVARLILTHADIDHYNLLDKLRTGGVSFDRIWYGCHLSLYSAVSAISTYLAGMERDDKTWSPGPAYYGGDKPPMKVEGVDVWLLAANAAGRLMNDDGPIKNGNSIVLLLRYGGVRIFLMGDATGVTERFILNSAKLHGTYQGLLDNEAGTALKMGHHGSETSSTRDWIERLRPNGLIVSSDTKTWRGSGIPQLDHVEDVISWSRLQQIKAHEVVMFDPSLPPLPPATPPKRARPKAGKPHVALKSRQKRTPRGQFMHRSFDQSFVTTLNDVRYAPGSPSPLASGHSWYWYVGAAGEVVVIPTEELPA